MCIYIYIYIFPVVFSRSTTTNVSHLVVWHAACIIEQKVMYNQTFYFFLLTTYAIVEMIKQKEFAENIRDIEI